MAAAPGVNYQALAGQYARQAGIDPNLFTSQIKQESGFDPTAHSSAGAEGIAQIVPRYHPGVNTSDPNASLKWAAGYMAGLVHKYGSYEKALSVYNSGKPDSYLDPNFAGGETYRYVRNIMGGGVPSKPVSALSAPGSQSGGRVATAAGTPLFDPGVLQNLFQQVGLPSFPGMFGAPKTSAQPSATPTPAWASSPTTAPTSGGFASPYPHDAPLGRVDQGLDYSRPYKGNVFAVGSGVVTKVEHGSWGGGGVVEYKLDHPITVNGRTYSKVYTAEAGKYLVRPGDRITAGQPIAFTQSGWQESGFAAPNGGPLAPLVGGLGAGTKPTSPGYDFLSFVKRGRNPSQL